MLRLKNVSKFYYNKGIIASGFSKINIKFELGEFVVITGESGSGKSTLLNVISGLDSYEEGEMYINGLETSHYRECDFEEYRKKYVSNIFQSFNLVNSYTVYQNVELVLLLNGYKKKDIKDKVLSLIDKVGLSRYKKTKVSKLSGGQKQRVAIARALAKETPIIVCDEPTGNLDSKSAREILNLLKEVSKDKLVIMVTHDYSSVENLATRVVQMHDGKILSDKKVKQVEDNTNKIKIKDYKGIGIFNVIRLGIRNTFNIIPKFVLMVLIFLFVSASLLTVYGVMEKLSYEISKEGENYYLSDTTDTRIIINKKDGSSISDNDFETLENLDNVDRVIHYDSIIDGGYQFSEVGKQNDYECYDFCGFYGSFRDINTFNGELDYGRMPENDKEIIVMVNKANEYESYYFEYELDMVMSKKYVNDYFRNYLDEDDYVSIVGVKFFTDYIGWNSYIYGSEKIVNKMALFQNMYSSSGTVTINDNFLEDASIYPLASLNKGEAYMYEGNSYMCKNYNCKNQAVKIDISNQYYSENINLTIKDLYNRKNYEKIFEEKFSASGWSSWQEWEEHESSYNRLYISSDDFNQLFNKDSYQASVYSDHVSNVDVLSKELDSLGYNALQVRKTLSNDNAAMMKILNIIKIVIAGALVFVLFFIAYFVIKLILKSRQVYFSTLRILGASANRVKRILDIELFMDASIGYIIFLIFIILVRKEIINVSMISSIVDYLHISHYIIMYFVLGIVSYLLSTRFAKKMFKKSAIVTYREEV